MKKRGRFKKEKKGPIPRSEMEELKTAPDPLEPDPMDPDDDEQDDDEQAEGSDGSNRGKPFGVRFKEWRDNLSDDIQKIHVYVYRLEMPANGQRVPKKIQAYAFSIPRDAEPPETHDIGCIVGSGDFDIIARTNGREIMRKAISFGPVYDELKEERKAQRREQTAAAPVPAYAVAPADPFASFGPLLNTLKPMLTPLVSAFAAALNPMENIRRMSAMGEEMAQSAFDFKIKTAGRLARDAVRFQNQDDDDQDDGRAVSPATRSNWDEKLSDLADLLMWKGKEFLSAKGDKAESMANTVKRKVLNDDAFQELLGNPAEFKVAYAKLCRDCRDIGGAETVGAILKKLGITPPVILKSAPQQQAKKTA